MFRYLNELWSPGPWQTYHSSLGVIKDITPNEKSIMLNNEPIGQLEKQKNTHINKLSGFLGRMRETILTLLQTFTLFNCFYSSDLNLIFAYGDFIAERHYRSLLHTFLIPYIQNCPPDYFPKLAILEEISNYLYNKLIVLWKDESLYQEDYEGTLTDQVIQEKFKRVFTRSVGDMWNSFFSTNVKDQTFKYPSFSYCLSRLLTNLFRDLDFLARIKDTGSCHISVLCFTRICKYITAQPDVIQYSLFLKNIVVCMLTVNNI